MRAWCQEPVPPLPPVPDELELELELELVLELLLVSPVSSLWHALWPNASTANAVAQMNADW